MVAINTTNPVSIQFPSLHYLYFKIFLVQKSVLTARHPRHFRKKRKPCQPVIPNGPARLFLFSVLLRIHVNAFVFIFFPNHFPEIFYRPLAMANCLRPGQPFDHMQPEPLLEEIFRKRQPADCQDQFVEHVSRRPYQVYRSPSFPAVPVPVQPYPVPGQVLPPVAENKTQPFRVAPIRQRKFHLFYNLFFCHVG